MSDPFDLRQYQRDAAHFLWREGGVFYAADPGLGKSAVAIWVARCLVAAGKVLPLRVLIVTTAAGRASWPIEIGKWGKGSAIAFEVVTYGELVRLERFKTLVAITYDLIVFDEAHKLKDPDAKTTKLAYFGWKRGKLALPSLYSRGAKVILLSGTPTPNHYGELWTHLAVTGRTQLSYDDFLITYCRTRATRWGVHVLGSDTTKAAQLRNHFLSGWMLRHRKKDVASELPPFTFLPVVELDIEDATLPNTAEHRILAIDAALDLASLADPFRSDALIALRALLARPKALAAAKWIKENVLAQGADTKVIVFAHHRAAVTALAHELKEFGFACITGETPPGMRAREAERFQTDPSVRVFVGNIQAAGTAITLTAASDVVFVEQDFVPGNNFQAASRAHRLGSANPVFVHTLAYPVADVDKRVADILRDKTRALAALEE